MTAVAVFDHQPDAAELLAVRLARGWRPTPSLLKEGKRVLGYAACVVNAEHGRREHGIPGNVLADGE